MSINSIPQYKRAEQAELTARCQEFLANGGKIRQVEPDDWMKDRTSLVTQHEGAAIVGVNSMSMVRAGQYGTLQNHDFPRPMKKVNGRPYWRAYDLWAFRRGYYAHPETEAEAVCD